MSDVEVTVERADEEDVRHAIDVDREALSIRDAAQEMFDNGQQFHPMAYYFRGDQRVAAVVCRGWDSLEDKNIAYNEMCLLIPTFYADEFVFGYTSVLASGDSAERKHEAISIMAANKVGMTMRIFPYYTSGEGVFRAWTEDGSDFVNWDPMLSSMVGAYMAYSKRPYMMSAMLNTLSKRGHTIEVFADPEAGTNRLVTLGESV